MQRSHSLLLLQCWQEYIHLITDPGSTVVIDGTNLSLAAVAAVARNKTSVRVSEDSKKVLEKSVAALERSMSQKHIIYGVNTGFGGSADTRTTKTDELQRVLVRELHYGVLATSSRLQPSPKESKRALSNGVSSQPPTKRLKRTSSKGRNSETLPDTLAQYHALSASLNNEDPESVTCMPRSWTKAAILIRMNSLALGYSGIRPVILDRMANLLAYDIIPCVPLRGSISASGDLSPLSYICGTLQAKPSLQVWSGESRSKKTAFAAFAEHGLDAVQMGPKESLAIVNGTATSCGVAILALNDVNLLAILAQVITAMSVEGLRGATESFHPLFAELRAHEGQKDVSRNISNFLRESSFVRDADDESESLRQDRYSIRTAAQWVGPVLEDLLLATEQLRIEANSVTDNPIIDLKGDNRCLHGGNFQAMAVTSAMEKARNSTYTIGRMLFCQVTELINPMTSRGLPPNLVVDEPSLSFIMKAVDLQSAALTSELGYLGHSVNNVQTAEQGNQSLNSLALISARYTHTAADVLSNLAAGHILAVCQALDIRAMLAIFFKQLEPDFHQLLNEHWSPKSASTAHEILWKKLCKIFDSTSQMNFEARFQHIAGELRATLLDTDLAIDMERVGLWRTALEELLTRNYTDVRNAFLEHGDASNFLGVASRKMYHFVRHDLGVPFLHSAILRSPDAESTLENGGVSSPSNSEPTPLTVGSYITKIYEAIRSGAILIPIMACLAEVGKEEMP